MSISNFYKKSILHRLQLVTAMLVFAFVLIAVVVVGSFMQVRNEISQVVQTSLQQTVENSRASRVLTQFLVRQRLLGMSFVGQAGYLPEEGRELQLLLQQLRQDTRGKELQSDLIPLQARFAGYLRQYRAVNELVEWRLNLNEDIDQALLFLEELIADKMIEAALKGENETYFEQLTMLLSGYRVSMLEIYKLNAEEDHDKMQKGALTAPPPLANELADLNLRLRTLTASEPPLDTLGRHLISQIEYYQHLMRRFQQEMIFLGRQTAALNQISSHLLAAMATLDQENSLAAQRASAEVTQTIQVAGLFILVFLSALTIVVAVTHQNLFRKHIQQPLETLRQRLSRFQSGDYSSLLPLTRDDEWGQIESGFNEMLVDLLRGWSALQESKRRYHAIFVNASEGIYVSTFEGKYVDINPAMANILGFDSAAEAMAEYTDIAVQLYVQPGFREQLIDRLRVMGSVRNVEVRLRRRNGEIFWGSLNAHLANDEQGDKVLMEGTLEDITSRRAAEESLRQLQRYLQNIIDSMPSILIGIDINCQVTLWNKQAELLCEIPALEAKGRALEQVFPLLAVDSYMPGVMKTLSTREPQRLLKLVSTDQTRQRYFNLLIYPLTTTEVSGAVIHIDEITERVKIEEVIVQSEKMLSVGGLAAGMAHEINNPLAAILQNAQVLSQRLSPVLDKNRQAAEALGLGIEQINEYVQQRGIDKMLQSITTSGQRAAKIVENMLSFSSNKTSNFLPRSLEDLVEQALVLASSDYDLKHKFDFRRIAIVREFTPVPDVSCEANQIQQVILNLLKNAAQALSANAIAPKIVLRIFQQERKVFLQLEDNGPGMAAGVSKRIFDPFYTTKAVGDGTGLGLSVAYFIVKENHQGTLTVTSAEGAGTCFSIGFPLQTEAAIGSV
jgi:PAS domain S-box-containing protein